MMYLSLLILVHTMFAGFGNFFTSEYENPNGKPFLISIGIEKNVHSLKYYDQSTFYLTAPISKLISLKYRENVKYEEDMVVLQSKHDKILYLDKHYALEFHLPFYALFK